MSAWGLKGTLQRVEARQVIRKLPGGTLAFDGFCTDVSLLLVDLCGEPIDFVA